MKKEEMKKMILEIVNELDYDIWKSLVPEYSELEEDQINDRINSMIKIVKKYNGGSKVHKKVKKLRKEVDKLHENTQPPWTRFG